MNVVVRGLMAAGMAVYGAIHAQQAFATPADAPGWLAFMFGLTALVAFGLAVALIVGAESQVGVVEHVSAAVAAGSFVALVLSFTTGFLGVEQDDIRAVTAVVIIAELLVVACWGLSRAQTSRTDEVSESVPSA